MNQNPFRVRTLMIAVALTALVLVLIGAVWRRLDIHIHDVHFKPPGWSR